MQLNKRAKASEWIQRCNSVKTKSNFRLPIIRFQKYCYQDIIGLLVKFWKAQ